MPEKPNPHNSSADGRPLTEAHPNDYDPATPFLSDRVEGEVRLDTPNGSTYGNDIDESDHMMRLFGMYGPHSFTRRTDGKKWDGNRSGE